MPSDTLHPWRYVTNAVGGSRLAAHARRWVVRRLYDHMARRYPHVEWTTMNYGYALLPGESDACAVDSERPEFLALQLYGRLAEAVSPGNTLEGLDVLEVGSGRGGGAAHVARCFGPRRLVALDVSPVATALAQRLHGGAKGSGVEFVQGDAESLPFGAESFDVVLNVESAHCYGSLRRFLQEAHRVLRPGGHLMFADFVSRRNGAVDRLLATLAESPFRQTRMDDITANVVAALAQDESRKRALLTRYVKGWFGSFARGAYAMEGSAMRRELVSGRTVYLAVRLCKEAGTGESGATA